MAEVKVAIANNFLDSFVRLPRQIQNKTTEFVNKFRNDPLNPGIHYEKLTGGMDQKIYSVRIDDTYRGIVVREDYTFLLLWVDHHDEAYEWARRKRCQINKMTGAIQIYDVQELKEKAEKIPGIFADVSDDDLKKLGVPEEIISFVKSLSSKEEFDRATSSLPQDAYENLSWLTEGIPVSEVLDMIASDSDEKSAGNLSEALDNAQTQKSFYVIPGEEELRQIMAAPLEKWRVFLHPTQRKIVEKNYSGPTRVLGGAGTGKTVVAMHRAKHLASGLTGREKLLFTTFTANLAQDIYDNLRKICTTEEMRHIGVVNLDSWVASFLNEHGYAARIGYGKDIQKLWDEAIMAAPEDLDFDAGFYEEEWNRVIEAQEVFTLPEYVRASRNGRGTRLDRRKRIEVWQVMDRYINLMKEQQIHDANYAMYECSKLVERIPEEQRYRHIVVDEGQDFSPNAYRLMRAMLGPDHDNDLFIVGDAHQRIYENHASLFKCGIHIRGRSSILRINYRTTEEIRQYAFALLKGISFDDLDDSVDKGDKCQSLTHGRKPVVKEFRTENEEVDFIDSEIKRLQQSGVQLRDICVVARTNALVDGYQADLTAKGYRAYQIKRSKTDDRSQDGIRVATMHRVKGLEFQYVFIAAVNDRIVPLKSAIRHTDKVTENECMTAEKCLLYVALTTAQKGAYISSYGRKSEFLK